MSRPPENATTQIIDKITNMGPWRALVVGDCMIDDFTFCNTTESKEIPSEMPGKRAYRANKRVVTLGGAANVAANLRSLGAATTLVGVVGRDGYDKALLHECEAHGIRPALVTDSQRPTTVKRRIYVDNEYFFRIDQEIVAPVPTDIANRVVGEVRELIADVDVLVISDYAKGVATLATIEQIQKLAQKWGVPIVVDAKPVNVGLFTGCTLLMPNLIEAQTLHPEFTLDAKLEAHTRRLQEITAANSIAVTLGAFGICGIHEGEFFHELGLPASVKDTVGAGDTVRAAVALGITSRLPFSHVLQLANAAGAVVVSKVGTSTASLTEVTERLARFGSNIHG